MNYKQIGEKCGIIAIKQSSTVFSEIILGLHSIQHRGQEGGGIIFINENNDFFPRYIDGLVMESFKNEAINQNENIVSAIGHVRYSTSGIKVNSCFNQPSHNILLDGKKMALAHNGNLINTHELYEYIKNKSDYDFISDVDSEILLPLIAMQRDSHVLVKIINALQLVKGSFALTIMHDDYMIGIRDRLGMRPLSLGRLPNGSYVFSSETASFNTLNATLIRDVYPGEMVYIDINNNINSQYIFKENKKRLCLFEYLYFARSDSVLEEHNSIYETRKLIGKQLYKESPSNADVIIPIPDSGIPTAIGYSQISGIPLEFGIFRSQYTGRTFIEPTNKSRNIAIKLKYIINNSIIKNKNIILIDDSIVRGNTIFKIIALLKEHGVNQIHIKIASPEIKYPCIYGIDIPKKEELISSRLTSNEIAKQLQVASLSFIKLEGLYNVLKNNNYCVTCFNGNYHKEYL